MSNVKCQISVRCAFTKLLAHVGLVWLGLPQSAWLSCRAITAWFGHPLTLVLVSRMPGCLCVLSLCSRPLNFVSWTCLSLRLWSQSVDSAADGPLWAKPCSQGRTKPKYLMRIFLVKTTLKEHANIVYGIRGDAPEDQYLVTVAPTLISSTLVFWKLEKSIKTSTFLI